jgi:uncharacterized protein (TIGR02246 family)
MEDRLAIRELIESYNDAVMRFDAEAWASNWTDDASWTLPGREPLSGRDEVVAGWKQAMQAFSFVGFFASAGPIIVDGDTARGTWYQQELLHQKDGVARTITGRYTDEYAKLGGRWYFRKRLYEILHAEANR